MLDFIRQNLKKNDWFILITIYTCFGLRKITQDKMKLVLFALLVYIIILKKPYI